MDRRSILKGTAALALLALPGTALAQGTVKIGVIMPFSGQFADLATQMDNGIKLYMKQKGDTVAGKKIEIIRKDTGGVAPDVATRLAQELVTRDNVDILAGMLLSPNTIAVSKVSAEAKKFMVIMNAATTVIITMSPYSVRASMTLPSVGSTAGAWAYKSGIRKAYTMVSDFAPGKDAEASFHEAFKAAGGEIVGSVRMPVANPDFSAFVQRAKDLNPESIFIFVPAGAQPAALGKAFAERGVDAGKIKIIGTGEVTDESSLKNMGDAGLGIISVWHYDYNDDSKLEQGVRGGLQRRVQAQPRLRRGRRLRRHARHLRGAEKDRRQDRWRQPGRGGQGPELRKPARAHPDRSRHPRHRADHLDPAGAQGRRAACATS